MIKFIKYFVQSIFIYVFFLIGKILGLKLSRLVFSNLFLKTAKFFKSEKILNSNLNIFSKNISEEEKKTNQILYVEKLWYDVYRVYLFRFF